MTRAPIRALDVDHRRRVATWMLACAVVFFAVALAAQLRVTVGAEWAVQRFAQTARTPALEDPMRAVTALGSGWTLLPAAAAICLLVIVRHPRLAVAIALAGAAGLLVANLAKVLVIRQRPNTVLWSFPSAHTFGVVVFAGLLLYVLWACDVPARWRRLAWLGGVLLALAVGVSRIYLNAHWVGDVVAGFAGGGAFLLAAVLAVDQRLSLAR